MVRPCFLCIFLLLQQERPGEAVQQFKHHGGLGTDAGDVGMVSSCVFVVVVL